MALSFSEVTHSGGSQLLWHEDTQAALRRSPSAAELGPPASSQPELVIHVRVSIPEGDPWPQASLPRQQPSWLTSKRPPREKCRSQNRTVKLPLSP